MTSKLHLLSFSLCLLFLFNVSLARSGRYQEFRQQNQCQLDNLRALEPDNRIESEAGLIESWNPNHDQFQCVGVAIARYHIKTNGLLLPSYTSAPRLVYIERGRGVLGIVFPGCPETFEESQQQQGQRRSNESFSEQDRHQKVRHFREGDILAIPAGVASWTYNDGDSELVSVSLLDTSNYENQLDQNPRRFYIAGNPKDEFKPQQQQHQQQSRRSEQSRRQQQHGSSANNVFSGFETRLLAEALNIDPETARKLQGENDNRGNIVRVERKLDFISPLSSREEQEREERGHEESEHGREQGRQQRQREEREREGRGQEESERGREQRRQQSQEHEREERGQEERGHGREQGRQQSQREERERERRGQEERQCGREQGRQQSPRGQGCQNGVEETFCTMRLTENIGDPSRADVYTPQAGRISTLNSYNLPILGHLRLSAERGVLYNNALYAPHWNLNANSVIFVLRGSARVQVVNDNGDAIFDGELRQGQVLTVPQNHAVLKKASSEGFEWVSFKTNDNAKVSPLAGRTSVIRALPEDVLRNAFQISREQARNLKYNREETTLLSSRSSSERRDERESSSDRRDERDERRDERESSSERRDERKNVV